MHQSLYTRLIAAGIEVSNHESDLYFPATEQTRAIVNQCLDDGVILCRPILFKSAIDGCAFYDAPFMFDPFWQTTKRN